MPLPRLAPALGAAALAILVGIGAKIALDHRASSAPRTEAPSEVVTWIRQSAIPLRSVDPAVPHDDLERLLPTLKGVRLVGLGEATHGTREFFLLKHRLLRFLVEKMGVTLFVIEGSYAGTLAIDEYVRTGKGDRARLLHGMRFWTWDTQEVLGMIDWMRQYNAKVPPERQVRFLGNDMQLGFRSAPRRLRGFYEKVAPAHLPEVEKTAKTIVHYADGPGSKTSEGIRRELPPLVPRLQASLDALRKDLATNREAYAAKSSPEDVGVAEMLLRTMGQFLLERPAPLQKSSDLRDQYMAGNTIRLMESLGPQTKAAVWAHNLHVSANPWMRRMGSHLRKALGEGYYSIGFAFYQGGFQAVDAGETSPRRGQLVPFTVPAAGPANVATAFANAEVGDLLIDFRQAPRQGAVAAWLDSPQAVTNIGAAFDPKWYATERASTPLTPRLMYDGMAFIRKTTAARPNRNRSFGHSDRSVTRSEGK